MGMNLDAALEQWRSLLGDSNVLMSRSAQTAYGLDTGGAQRVVAAALIIRDIATVQETIRIAYAHHTPVYPISTGHNWGYGSSLPVRDGSVILDLSALQRIIDFDAELGVVTVEPGVTQQLLADFLDAGDHPYLVPVTGAGPTCSLMGNALERGYGITPHADHFGAVTDIEAVLSDGQMYRTVMHDVGSVELARLFKWGIGPYSAGLFTQGSFGVITSMSIVLARRPERVEACFFALERDALLEPAVLAVRTLLTRLPSTVGAINLMNQHRMLGMAAPFPVGQLGLDGLIGPTLLTQLGEQYQVFPWTGFASLYGTASVVAAAKKEIRRTLSGVASRLIFVTPERASLFASAAHWIPGRLGRRLVQRTNMLRRSLELVAGRPSDVALNLAYWRSRKPPSSQSLDPARDGCGLIWYSPLVPMRPERVRAYVDMITDLSRRRAMEPLITLTSLNDRLFDSTVPLLFDRDSPSAVASAQACYKEMLVAGRSQGCFPYRVGVETMPYLAELQTDSKVFAQLLRHSCDPRDVIAPGRYM